MSRTLKEIRNSLFAKYKGASVITRASFWFVIVSVIDKGVSLLTQPILNRILSVSEVGVYNVYHSWDSIFVVVSSFYLYCGVLEVLITKEKEDEKQVVVSLCSLSILISVIFYGILLIFVTPISEILGLKPVYLTIMAITTITTTIYSFWSVPKRFNYDYKMFSIVGVSVFVVKSVLSVLFAYIFTWDRVLGRLLGLCIPNVVVAIVLLRTIIKGMDSSRVTHYWKRGLLFNLPLIPHYLSQVLLASSDRIMIQKLLPDGEIKTGLYSVAYSIAALTLIVFTAINNAYQPFALKAIKQKDYHALSQKTNTMVLVSVVFASLVSLLAPEGLYILGGQKYMESVDIIPILVVGVFLSSFYFIFSNIEFIYEKTKYIFPITLVGACLNISLNYFLIPRYGYQAAAYTTFIGYVVIALCHYYISYRIERKNIYDMRSIMLYIGSLVLIAGLSRILFNLEFWLRWILILLLSVFLLYMLIYKKTFKRN